MMQFPRPTRFLGAAIAGVICFAVVFSSGYSNDRARRLLARDVVQRQIDQVSGRLTDQLRLLRADATAVAALGDVTPADQRSTAQQLARREITWRYDGTALIAGQQRRAEHELLEQALLRSVPAHAANALLGPYPAADGEDYMIGWAAAPSQPGQWGAAAVPLTTLLLAAGVKELNSGGLSVRLQSTQDQRVLFQSRSGPMLDPALAHVTVGVIGVGGLDWSLAALPAVGWGRPALVGVLISLLFAAAFGCASYRWLGQREAMAAERESWRLAQQKLDLRLTEAIRAADSAERRNMAVNDVDVSTGLATRSAFCTALERQLGDVRANPGARIVVAVVLLEPAHVIVAAYGERILASVLAQAAGRIKGITGWSQQVGRVGELELAAWIVLGQSRAEAEQAIAGLAAQLAPPYVSEAHTVHAPAVIGFSSSADGYAYAEEMVSQAVTVARDSPRGQPGSFHEYEPALRERAITRLQLEDELHKGIANDSLRLYFQPILVSDTRQLVGFEALLRWQHPLEGLLTPARFLPAAVSAGLMLEIDRWVMRQAVMQLRQWNLTAPGQYFLSFNMSPQHFVRPELVAELSDLIDGYEVNPQQLHIEIVEQTLINDIQVAVEIARGLRELGAELSLDDFGTGYSSLNYLRTFPVNSLKIDHSFINRMVDDSKDFGVVKTIIDLAHYLGLQCIAEGVESNEQHDLLQMLGPDYCQGFLYSPPVPAEQAQRLMQPSEARLRSRVG